MEEIEVTWKHAIQVWWSWLWRAMIIVIPLSFIVGLFAGLIMNALSINIQENSIYLNAVGGFIGIYFSISVMKKILNKRFNGYRIALLKVHQESEIDA